MIHAFIHTPLSCLKHDAFAESSYRDHDALLFLVPCLHPHPLHSDE